MPLKAIFFDLDDTLFDHRHSSQAGLLAVKGQFDCFQQVPFAEFEHQHRELLERYHLNVLKGTMTLDDARLERFRQLFLLYGEAVAQSTMQQTVDLYRKAYIGAERQVEGAAALLQRLRGHNLKLAVVTNSTVDEQIGKLKRLKLNSLIDTLVVSEEIGVAKPDPRIFEAALQRVGCACDEVVMVGDSWSADIVGARAANIRPIWLNRHQLDCPDTTMAQQITAFVPVDFVLDLILG